MDEVRTRFAPSPTGYLHIGGARTALFNWLFSRHHKGKFILRIEDTDRERSTQAFTDAILQSMEWLNLDYDEGPFFQSERYDLYREAVKKLLDSGKAYRCRCTKDELDGMRAKALAEGKPPGYDRRCRDKEIKESDGPFSVRFAAPADGETVIEDMVKGTVVIQNQQIDDLIIMRSDGTPTYNFVVVVDDATMGINHVIRGEDHLANTPKQIQICSALGYTPPKFAHVPLILGTDKARLSKRHGATSVEEYRNQGFVAEALMNYLVRLGWSSGDQEVFSIEEMVKLFDLTSVSKSAGIFNPEKLLWMNSVYIRDMNEEEFLKRAMPFLELEGYEKSVLADKAHMLKILTALKPRSRTLIEIAKSASYFFTDEITYKEDDLKKWIQPGVKELLEKLLEYISQSPRLEQSGIEDFMKNLCAEQNIKLVKIAQPVRIALTGTTVSPGLFEIMEIIGKEAVEKRIKRFIEKINTL